MKTLEGHTAVEFFECNFSLLWAPQSKFTSPPLCSGGSRTLTGGYPKTRTHKIKTICMARNHKKLNEKVFIFIFCNLAEPIPYKHWVMWAWVGRNGRDSAWFWPPLCLCRWGTWVHLWNWAPRRIWQYEMDEVLDRWMGKHSWIEIT